MNMCALDFFLLQKLCVCVCVCVCVSVSVSLWASVTAQPRCQCSLDIYKDRTECLTYEELDIQLHVRVFAKCSAPFILTLMGAVHDRVPRTIKTAWRSLRGHQKWQNTGRFVLIPSVHF
jgi:hypothetical protein